MPLEVPSLAKRFVPQYFGGPNAFSIQLFCIDERYEMRSVLNKFSIMYDLEWRMFRNKTFVSVM